MCLLLFVSRGDRSMIVCRSSHDIIWCDATGIWQTDTPKKNRKKLSVQPTVQLSSIVLS